MKKAIHNITSYLGAFMFFAGIMGTVLKWCGYTMHLETSNPQVRLIITITALIFGLFMSIRCYKPLKCY